jgi:probable rRNA maturation factor
LEELGLDDSVILSISVVDSQEMAALNREYRNKEGDTNVLAFSQLEGETAPPEKDLLGDVVICAQRAASDADELGYTLDEMLLYLLIHGVVHLSGYTHDSEPDAMEMNRRVEEVFQRLAQ